MTCLRSNPSQYNQFLLRQLPLLLLLRVPARQKPDEIQPFVLYIFCVQQASHHVPGNTTMWDDTPLLFFSFNYHFLLSSSPDKPSSQVSFFPSRRLILASFFYRAEGIAQLSHCSPICTDVFATSRYRAFRDENKRLKRKNNHLVLVFLGPDLCVHPIITTPTPSCLDAVETCLGDPLAHHNRHEDKLVQA